VLLDKTYVGGHDVYYRGFREGKGIWGLWELTVDSGGFHIWPRGEEESEQEHESAEEPGPLEAVAAQTAWMLRHSGVNTERKATPRSPATADE
jgi:hypothetical protein